MQIFHTIFNAPFGNIHLCANSNALIAIDLKGDHSQLPILPGNIYQENTNEILKETIHQLAEYFDGQRKVFTIPLLPEGSNFQKLVWSALQNIPFGSTWSYFDVAKKIDNINSVRAVGNANGKNPIPILIPCHRVIQKNGSIGGYSGGIEIKRWLLKHEGILLF